MKNLAKCDIAAKNVPVCGRFAPSPSGDLHLGSLVTAVGSWLAAKAKNGQWLIRIEDLDSPRCVVGAADRILTTLASYALYSDAPVWYQSQRQPAYHAALVQLQQQGWVYPCACSRRDVQARGQLGAEGMIYDGHCRIMAFQTPFDWSVGVAWRCRVPALEMMFEDRCQGLQTQNLSESVGDFVVRRADGLFSYQLAVVVDDAAQGVTHVVRGLDLLSSTPRQILLQQYLHLPTPEYAHLPLVLQDNGQKFSKQNLAPAIAAGDPVLLWQVLHWLGLTPPSTLRQALPAIQLAWAREAWTWTRLRCESAVWKNE